MKNQSIIAIFAFALMLAAPLCRADAPAQKEQGPLKTVCCPSPCDFCVSSHDEKELIEIVKAHAKKYHGMDLTDEQVRKLIKTNACCDKCDSKGKCDDKKKS